MKLAKYLNRHGEESVGHIVGEQLLPLDLSGGQYNSLSDILDADDPLEVAHFLASDTGGSPVAQASLLPPIDGQEVWAAGVTYKRSQAARMEESDTAASCYDQVYASPRPELFFKAMRSRVSGPGQSLRIRSDSQWDVPEPELTLVLNSRMQLVGFTIGNDMSSRDIEGANPLYLPQAKVYDQCCGLGPCITLAGTMPPRDEITIELIIRREGAEEFRGQTSVTQMARSFENLIEWLSRDNSFPNGVFLLTGTGIVPDSSFTLQADDTVEITIAGIGTLANSIVRG